MAVVASRRIGRTDVTRSRLRSIAIDGVQKSSDKREVVNVCDHERAGTDTLNSTNELPEIAL